MTEAMRIVASIAEWEEMTGLTFRDSGDYIVADALSLSRLIAITTEGLRGAGDLDEARLSSGASECPYRVLQAAARSARRRSSRSGRSICV
jgi:hypothetical protein